MYLSKDVHYSVQTQCVQTCRTLASFDEDMMWLLMVQICPNLLPPLPHPSLKPIKVCLLICVLYFVLYSYLIVLLLTCTGIIYP